MVIKTTPFEPEKYFKDDVSQVELIADAFESGDAGYIADAIGIVARARGMTKVAQESGIAREALYQALSAKGNPTLTTLLKVMKVLGIELTAKSREAA